MMPFENVCVRFYDGECSVPLNLEQGLRQGQVLATTLFETLFTAAPLRARESFE